MEIKIVVVFPNAFKVNISNRESSLPQANIWKYFHKQSLFNIVNLCLISISEYNCRNLVC